MLGIESIFTIGFGGEDNMSIDLLRLDEIIKKATDAAVNEVLKPLLEDERDKQEDMSDRLSELEAEEADEALEEADDEEDKDTDDVIDTKIATGKEEEEEPKAVIPSADDVAKVDVGQIINMLNMLRSGKSTKDPDIKKKLSGYFDGLDPGERQALFILLSGLSQILAGGVDGEEAPDPSTVGIKISARRATQDISRKEKEAAKKSTLKTKGSSGDQASGSEELPIVVGESANKAQLLRKVKRLLR